MTPIADLVVGAYGFTHDTESQIAVFLADLREKCNLDGVEVSCVQRAHAILSGRLRDLIVGLGFYLHTCPLAPSDNSREDTSRFSDWMVQNIGHAPWVGISHFDIKFNGDYLSFVKAQMASASMIGNHHDGIVFVRREDYYRCQVGFCGIDGLAFQRVHTDAHIIPRNSPHGNTGECVLAMDVGELLALRMATLGLRHVWLQRGDSVGKSDLFVHTRRGSGHGGFGTDNDQ